MNLIKKNLNEVLQKMEEAYRSASITGQRFPRLIAVSKEKPIKCIIEAYLAGQRYFGENKIVDLFEKSHAPDIINQCPDIKWHFIGRIQSNKIKKLVNVRNLDMVETLDSLDHAVALNSAWAAINQQPLNCMIQVNTSGEIQKGGINPSDIIEVYKSIESKCPSLQIIGLMCIGQDVVDLNLGPNPDFLQLFQCRSSLAEFLGKSPNDFELSMGMSNDFEHAIHLGSTNIRVGTTIFGSRNT